MSQKFLTTALVCWNWCFYDETFGYSGTFVAGGWTLPKIKEQKILSI